MPGYIVYRVISSAGRNEPEAGALCGGRGDAVG